MLNLENDIKHNVDQIIHNYRNFLLSSWRNITFITELLNEQDKEEFINDFCQANWELMVEGPLCSPGGYLEAYGYGADSNGASSRILYPDQVPTHKIVCNKIKDNVINKFNGLILKEETLDFDGFVNNKNNSYLFEPPFDHVLINLSTEHIIVSLEDVRFTIEPVN